MTCQARLSSLVDGYIRCENCGNFYAMGPYKTSKIMRIHHGWQIDDYGQKPILCPKCKKESNDLICE